MVVKLGHGEIELVNHAFVTDDVDFAAFICAERGDALGRIADLADDLKNAVMLFEAEDAMGCLIAADVNAVERGMFVAAIDVTTGD